jgi:predicted DNA binding CopG/RHH family protein
MRTNNLDTEEREMLESYERGEWHSIGTLQERQKYQAYAVAAVGVKGQISISLPLEDLRVVQQKATEAGVPYQKLIADLVHKFISGRLVERPTT